MIILTGATGQLGRLIAERLLDRDPSGGFGVSVRDPEKAAALAARGVRVRHGDFEDPASLRHSFEGATQVLVVSSGASGEAALRGHRNAVEAARAVGARRVVYTSHMGANPASRFPPMRVHAATEAMLRESGMSFVSLRNGFYAESGLMLMGDFAESGEVVAPEDGPVSWTTRADLAEAAAASLADEGSPDGPTPPLTGSEALDLDGLVALASEIAGRTIRRVVAGDEEFRAGLVSRGVPEERIGIVMGLYAASREGEFSAVDPALERRLGRAPTAMREALAEQIAR